MRDILQLMARVGFRGPAPVRAFTLFQMVITLGMLSTFALISVRLINLSFRLPADAAAAERERVVLDGAIERLRQDVWAATAVEGAGGGSLSIRSTDAVEITWRAEDDGSLTRQTSAGEDQHQRQNWAGLGKQVRFEWDGAFLNVTHNPTESGGVFGKIRMPSQPALARQEARR